MSDAAPVWTLSCQAALLFCTNRRGGEVTHSSTHSLTQLSHTHTHTHTHKHHTHTHTHIQSWRKCWAISFMHCETTWKKHTLWFPIWTRQNIYPGLQSVTRFCFLISGIKALGSCNFSVTLHETNFLKQISSICAPPNT